MGILKDAGESFLKYSEIVVNKTEMLGKVAKLKLDIKKNENEIADTHRKLGELILDASGKSEDSLNLHAENVKELIQKVSDLNSDIEIKNSEIESLKKTLSDK